MLDRQIGHFKIVKQLGSGGMGVVYQARDERLDRFVALKFLPEQLTHDEQAKQRFITEAKAASALDHPNICTIYEINETDDGKMFIAMGYYEGETLQSLIAGITPTPVKGSKSAIAKGGFRGIASISEILDITLQIAHGLVRAHENGIVHRDIKPANIMITKSGLIKILDFGLAKLATQSHLTKTGSTIGTVVYMSPEQTRGADLDQRSDIWSLGVVLYEMITGHLPFQGAYEAAVIYSINNEKPVPVQNYRQDVKEDVIAVIGRTLEKDQANRYQTMAEFLGDIERVVAGDPVSVKKRHGAHPWRQRIRTAMKYGVWPILFILILAAYWLFNRSNSGTGTLNSQVIAVMPFAYHGAPEFAYLAEGMVDLLSTSLDGAGMLRNVDPRAILIKIKALKGQEVDAQRANDIASRFSAGLCLLGTIVEMRGQLRLSASLYETSSTPKAVQQVAVDGGAEKIYNLVDEITSQIITKRFGKPAQQLMSVGAATTRSNPALKAYLEAIQAERNGQISKEYDLLKRAVAADSTFAIAWYQLSSYAFGWMANVTEARYAMERAKKYGANLNERYRFYLDGLDYIIKGENLLASDTFRKLVAKYPDDVNGWFNVAGDFTHNFYGRPNFEPEPWKRLIELDPDNGMIYQQMLPFVLRTRNLDEIDRLIAKLLELSPEHEYAWMYVVPRAFIAGDRDGQKKAIAEANNKPDLEVNIAAWNVAVEASYPEAAAPFFQILADPSKPLLTRLSGYHSLALGYAGKGKMHMALAVLDTAAALHPAAGLIFRAYLSALPFLRVPHQELQKIGKELEQWQAEKEKNIQASEFIQSMPVNIYPQTRLYLLGLTHAALGDYSRVEEYAGQLLKMQTPYDEASIVEQWSLTLKVLVAMNAGDNAQALALLESSNLRIRFSLYNYSFYSFAYQRYLRGELLCQLNRHREALPWFLSIADAFFSDDPLLAMARLRCAEACEKLGQKNDAVKYYRDYISLWKDGDPELQPMVVEVEKRLAELKGGGK